MRLNCHFFIAESNEIEFDLDPGEVTNEKTFQRLLDLLISIGQMLGKEVRLTPEGGFERAMLWFEPSTGDLKANWPFQNVD